MSIANRCVVKGVKLFLQRQSLNVCGNFQSLNTVIRDPWFGEIMMLKLRMLLSLPPKEVEARENGKYLDKSIHEKGLHGIYFQYVIPNATVWSPV